MYGQVSVSTAETKVLRVVRKGQRQSARGGEALEDLLDNYEHVEHKVARITSWSTAATLSFTK